MKDRSALRSYFITNRVPKQEEFQDFIDSVLNQAEDGIQKIQGGPVAVQAQGAGEDLLFFYKNLKDTNPTWRINQNPGANQPGLNISDATGASRLFIKSPEGNVGIGTLTPLQKLSVGGDTVISGNLGIGTATSTNEGSRLSSKGNFGIKGNNPQIDFIDNDNKQWAIHVNANKMYFIREPWNYTDLVLDGNGNVGFGTDSPAAKLQVAGGAIMPAAGDTGGIQFPNDPMGIGSGDSAWIRYYARSGESMTFEMGVGNDGDDHIALMPSGNVGIGINNPLAKLHVNGAIHAGSSDIYFTDTKHSHTGYGNTAGFAAIENSVNYDALMILGRAMAGTPAIRRVKLWDYLQVNGSMDITGSLGIGTTTPRAKLDVVGSSVPFPSLTYAFLNKNGAGGPGTWANVPASICASDRIIASEFDAMSDFRIKTDIEASNGAADLLAINKLEVADYRFKEISHYTSEKKKGFIAQQVEKIIPEAVSKHKDFIPSINALPLKVDLENNILEITTEEAHGLVDGDVVRLVTAKGNKEVKIKVMNENAFTVSDWEEETREVFVFGKQVEDLRTLNYDHIFCTGISAIQQLYRQMQYLKEQLAEVTEKLSAVLVPAM